MAVTPITLSGTYLQLNGDPAKGTVAFTLSATLENTGADVIYPQLTWIATLDNTGSFEQTLPANNDTDSTPSGVTYSVKETITGGANSGTASRTYSITLDHAGGATQNLADLAIAASAPAVTYGLLPADLASTTDATKGAAYVGYKHPGTGAVGRTVYARLNDTVNVKDFGATGDGVTDDTTAIQAAIDAAALLGSSGILGTTVYLPEGNYLISAPLVLPRSGSSATTSVWINGANYRTTALSGSVGFPTNRGMIEWDTNAVSNWHQSIQNLRFNFPTVAGVRAIKFALNGANNETTVRAQRTQIELNNLHLIAHNDYHPYMLEFQGSLWYSTLTHVYGDPSLGSATYDTCVLKLDYQYDNGSGTQVDPPVTGDFPGLAYSTVNQMFGTLRRGGNSRVIEGRCVQSNLSGLFGFGGTIGPVYDLYNCALSSFSLLGTEGQNESIAIRMTNCVGNTFREWSLGTPDGTGQTGLALVGSTDNVFDNRSTGSASPVWSTAISAQVVTLDANSKRNVFTRFRARVPVSGTLATEITDTGGAANFNQFTGIDPNTGELLQIGNSQSSPTGTATWDPPSLINGETATTSVTVPGANVGDPLVVGFSSISSVYWSLTAIVNSANTVSVKLTNNTGSTVDLASGTLKVRVNK